MKKHPNWKTTTLLTVAIISCLPALLPYIFSTFGLGVSVSIPVSTHSYKTCVSVNESPCRASLVFRPDLKQGEVTFFGISNTPPTITCLENGQKRLISPHLWISNVPIFKNTSLNCAGELVSTLSEEDSSPANAWSLPFSVTGSVSRVAALIKALNFYLVDFRPLLAVVALFQLGITLLIFRTIGGELQAPANIFSFVVVAIMAIVNGGLIEKLCGVSIWESNPLLKYYLSNLWFLIFVVETLVKSAKLRTMLLVATATLAFTYFERILIGSPIVLYTMLIIGWGTFAAYQRQFLPTALFLLNSSYLVPVYTPFAILPVFAASLYLMVYMFGYQIEFIRLMLLDWRLGQMASTIKSTRRCLAYVKLISRVYGVDRISLAVARQDSFSYWIYSAKRQMPLNVLPEGQSSVISRVYATGESILDLDVSSELGARLSNKGGTYKSQRFTAVPVLISGEIAGVLSFTDYDRRIRHPDIRGSLIKTLASSGKNLGVALASSNNDRCFQMEEVAKSALSSSETLKLDLVVKRFLELIFDQFSVSGYLGKVEGDGTLNVIQASGAITRRIELLNGLKFSVNPKNEFGPISIAFKEMRPVILQNWKPISDKLSPAAKRMYIDLETNSILTIPITRTVGTTSIRYLIWLQTDAKSVFTQQFSALGHLVQLKIEQLVDVQFSRFMNDTVLSLADSDAIRAIANGEESRVNESGELLMVDLGKSTVLSKLLGPDSFQHLKEAYIRIVLGRLGSFGYKLQMVMGDALLLTRPDTGSAIQLGSFLNALLECEVELRECVKCAAPEVYSPQEPALRFCSVKGDISRDLVKGSGGGWTIVGSTISEVHKVESLAKKYRQGIYFELDLSPIQDEFISMERTEGVPWPGAPRVRYLIFRGSEIQVAA
jgi:hypothetical protein